MHNDRVGVLRHAKRRRHQLHGNEWRMRVRQQLVEAAAAIISGGT